MSFYHSNHKIIFQCPESVFHSKRQRRHIWCKGQLSFSIQSCLSTSFGPSWSPQKIATLQSVWYWGSCKVVGTPHCAIWGDASEITTMTMPRFFCPFYFGPGRFTNTILMQWCNVATNYQAITVYHCQVRSCRNLLLMPLHP